MRARTLVAALLLIGATAPAMAKDGPPPNWDGLVQVNSDKLEYVYLMPGTDFKSYTSLLLGEPEVAFAPNWLKDMNDQDMDGEFNAPISKQDAIKKLQVIQKTWAGIFDDGFTREGFTLTQTPGPNVLRVNSAIANIYINNPDRNTAGMGGSFSANAGQATMIIELRDAATNTLLARIIDSEATQATGAISNAGTNLNAFKLLADRWTKISVNGLKALQSISPIPKTLTPGQKLP